MILNWEPILNFNEAVYLTTVWYRKFYMKKNCFNLSKNQILYYEKKFIKKISKRKLKIFK